GGAGLGFPPGPGLGGDPPLPVQPSRACRRVGQSQKPTVAPWREDTRPQGTIILVAFSKPARRGRCTTRGAHQPPAGRCGCSPGGTEGRRPAKPVKKKRGI